MKMPNPVNSRKDDLILLAKNHYRTPKDRVEGARRVVTIHNLNSFDSIRDVDVAHVVVHDLIELLLGSLNQWQVADLLLNLGPRPPIVPGYYEHPDGFYAGLITSVLDKVAMIRVIGEKGEILIPLPKPDPSLVKLCAAEDASACLREMEEEVEQA